MLWPVEEFLSPDTCEQNLVGPPTYWYRASAGGQTQQLPRTPLVEAIARGLMQQLEQNDSWFPTGQQEGKMYGVLLVQTPTGSRGVLKAFSGSWQGQRQLPGWVPPIPGRDLVALSETQTLAQLNAIQQELLTLQQLPQRQVYAQLCQQVQAQRQVLNAALQKRQQQRQQQRELLSATLSGPELIAALADLEQQSRSDSREKREFKQACQARLSPLMATLTAADQEITRLKQQRRDLSRQLQIQMHAVYHLTNFASENVSLEQLSATLPTGTGDCCAPKLLHYAASHQLQPLAMAEFWWGSAPPDNSRTAGQFYGACRSRCQPLLGFLLRGLPNPIPAMPAEPNWRPDILYEDEWLIGVHKPAGLLSVPGRCSQLQDSLWSRLMVCRHHHHSLLSGELLSCHRPRNPNLRNLEVVHRLDRNTSGVILFAKDPLSQRQLQQQFRQRQVQKIYEAIVLGPVPRPEGEITLPLWGDPHNRPYQSVDYERGKPSLTRYQVLQSGLTSRLEFYPVTGRTHQLRVHAAHPRGLGTPILGDRLYGGVADSRISDSRVEKIRDEPMRLHLHARELRFWHPHGGQELCLQADTPF